MLPDDDKDIEDMASSADLKDAQEQVDTSSAAAATAETSTATGETEDDGLLSVVRDVVDARKPDAQAASPAEGEEEKGQDDADDKDDDDYSKVPFSKHPDFRRLVRKKNEYRDQAKAHAQDAGRYQNVQNFMDQNGLGAEEAADLLIIGGLIRTNPVEAWKRMKPTIQKLLVAAGEVLPDELRQRVQKGEMSQEAALQVSRSNASVHAMSATRSFEERKRQQIEQQSAQSAVALAAETWEADRHEKDPNFKAKLPLLMREVAYLQRVEGKPDTPEGVKAQLEKAYKSVVLPVAAVPTVPAPRVVPAPKRAITPIRGGAVAGGAKPEIKSTMDVLTNVMAKRRSA